MFGSQWVETEYGKVPAYEIHFFGFKVYSSSFNKGFTLDVAIEIDYNNAVTLVTANNMHHV